MDLISNYPFWLLDQGIIRTYPSLSANRSTEVAVMGGGISGALTAWQLCKAGVRVILVDRRHIGMGSTVGSTSLLQYEIDKPLTDLIRQMGENRAARCYQLSVGAIGKLEKICAGLSAETGFKKRPSLQYASFLKHVPALREEYKARKRAGISLHWLEQGDLESKFGFKKNAALLSTAGAEVNAYALTHALLKDCGRAAIEIYDHTEIQKIVHHQRGIELISSEGKRIKARKLVIACGYESQQYLPKKVEQFKSTYAIVSEPLSSADLWFRNALIWETANPYLYLRTTADQRVLIGGKDDEFSSPVKREAALPRKVKLLENSFRKLFPKLDFKTDFQWAGVFASTRDGLPYIGSVRQRPHTFFALGFGGNGIIFSQLASEIIRDRILGTPNEAAGIFGFDR